MNKIKIIFSQTLMISTGILFSIGVQNAILHFIYGTQEVAWEWYIPLTIVLGGFLCALPTLIILYAWDSVGNVKFTIGTIIHFICEGGIVTLCGYVFGWYKSWSGYWPILIMYVVIYFFVWIATVWIAKNDEKKINEAIKDLRDEE